MQDEVTSFSWKHSFGHFWKPFSSCTLSYSLSCPAVFGNKLQSCRQNPIANTIIINAFIIVIKVVIWLLIVNIFCIFILASLINARMNYKFFWLLHAHLRYISSLIIDCSRYVVYKNKLYSHSIRVWIWVFGIIVTIAEMAWPWNLLNIIILGVYV